MFRGQESNSKECGHLTDGLPQRSVSVVSASSLCLGRFFGEILLPAGEAHFRGRPWNCKLLILWQVTEATGLLLHRKLSPKVFLEFLRGSLQRCGAAPEVAASATYNKLRRFLPTGANVLGWLIQRPRL